MTPGQRGGVGGVGLRPLPLAAYAVLESREGFWRPDEIVAEATAAGVGAHRFFQGLGAAGQHLGCVWVAPLPERWRRYVAEPATARYLMQLTVAAGHRGRGYGRALLAAAAARLAADGVTELCLDVNHTNDVARGLYTSAGFAVAYELETKTGMSKRLTAGGA